MYFSGRWVPIAVVEYFIGFTVIVVLLVGIAFLWTWWGKHTLRKIRSKTALQTMRAKRKKRKRR